ncbi:MAG: helix-turn-helix domain-containing protein [Treponema sp.]|nr:helix-turn-helix domain-containing protein [Treponema sp.]
MSKQNIIQRRELEPLMLKAISISKHYEKATNYCASVIGFDLNTKPNNFYSVCGQDNNKICTINSEIECVQLHMEAIYKARALGGSYIYSCPKGFVFWTSPFYSGERLAGAFFSGDVKKTEKDLGKLKALALIMQLCANQISDMSFVQKNVGLRAMMFKPSLVYDPYKSEFSGDDTKNKCLSSDMERQLLASLRRGDNSEGQKILENLLATLYEEVKCNFQVFKLKATELAVLLSRAAVDPQKIKDNTDIETTRRNLKKIEESASTEEVNTILSAITDNMAEVLFSFHGVRHFSAIKKAERYIWAHYTRKLSLKEIAAASGLSAPYFSTIFKEEMGENLSSYLNRLRIEKAATMLVTTDLPISEISSACGFEDQSWFSKIFKNNTGLTPGKYRERGMNAVTQHNGRSIFSL